MKTKNKQQRKNSKEEKGSKNKEDRQPLKRPQKHIRISEGLKVSTVIRAQILIFHLTHSAPYGQQEVTISQLPAILTWGQGSQEGGARAVRACSTLLTALIITNHD